MSYCGPSNAVPSYAAIPSVGFASDNCGFGSRFSYGGSALGSVGVGSGFSYGGSSLGSLSSGATVPAASLGVLQEVQPAPIVQIPPSECVMLPPPFVITIPGVMMSATSEELKIGGDVPYAVPDSGSGLEYGNISRGLFSERFRFRSRGVFW